MEDSRETELRRAETHQRQINRRAMLQRAAAVGAAAWAAPVILDSLAAPAAALTPTPSNLVYSAIGPPTTWTSKTTQSVSYPLGTVANDLLFLIIATDADKGGPASISSWTTLANVTDSGKDFTLQVYQRLSGGEGSVSLQVDPGSGNFSGGWVVRYVRPAGYPPNPTSAAASFPSAAPASASISMTPATNITTNTANARVISIVGQNGANTLSLSTPAGFTLQTTATDGTTPGVAIGIADQLVVSAGTVTSPTWQSSASGFWGWATVAYA
jgi:hypothetical protein